MRMMLIVLSPLLAGCATEPDWQWEKRGASQEEWHMDSGQCRAQAFSNTPQVSARTVMIFESCLEGRGWYKVRK